MTCPCCNGLSCSERNCIISKFNAAIVSVSGSAAFVGDFLCTQRYGQVWASKLTDLSATFVAPRIDAATFSAPASTPPQFGNVSVRVGISGAPGVVPPCSVLASASVSVFNIFGAGDCWTEFYVVGVQSRMCRAPANCVSDTASFPYRLDSSNGRGTALVSACDGSCIESREFSGTFTTNQCAFGTEQRCGGSALGAVVARFTGSVTVTLV